jgi:hypothetical protein
MVIACFMQFFVVKICKEPWAIALKPSLFIAIENWRNNYKRGYAIKE